MPPTTALPGTASHSGGVQSSWCCAALWGANLEGATVLRVFSGRKGWRRDGASWWKAGGCRPSASPSNSPFPLELERFFPARYRRRGNLLLRGWREETVLPCWGWSSGATSTQDKIMRGFHVPFQLIHFVVRGVQREVKVRPNRLEHKSCDSNSQSFRPY